MSEILGARGDLFSEFYVPILPLGGTSRKLKHLWLMTYFILITVLFDNFKFIKGEMRF